MRLLVLLIITGLILGACSKSENSNLSGLWIQVTSANHQNPFAQKGVLVIEDQDNVITTAYINDPDSREYSGKYIIEKYDNDQYINNGQIRSLITPIDENRLTFFNNEYLRVANNCQETEDKLYEEADKYIIFGKKLQKNGVNFRNDLTKEELITIDLMQDRIFYARNIYDIYATILQDFYAQKCGVKIPDPYLVNEYLDGYIEAALGGK